MRKTPAAGMQAGRARRSPARRKRGAVLAAAERRARPARAGVAGHGRRGARRCGRVLGGSAGSRRGLAGGVAAQVRGAAREGGGGRGGV